MFEQAYVYLQGMTVKMIGWKYEVLVVRVILPVSLYRFGGIQAFVLTYTRVLRVAAEMLLLGEQVLWVRSGRLGALTCDTRVYP